MTHLEGASMTAVTQPARIRMSLEEFERLPEGPPYYDYIDGEAIEVNRPRGRHQVIEMRLANRCWEHVHAQQAGEVFRQIDVRLPTGNWVGPDIVFIAAEHLDRYDKEKGDRYGAPDLAVEVTSPTTVDYDRGAKIEQYFRSEVPWVWIVDQETLAIEEFQWTPEGYARLGAVQAGEVLRPRLFPGLEIDLKALIGEQAG
jgi:Uma2 family endonuclease